MPSGIFFHNILAGKDIDNRNLLTVSYWIVLHVHCNILGKLMVLLIFNCILKRAHCY